ncbi:ABC transporter permease [Sphingopyxis sp. MWB1]|uniref:ABC transporter permease n=1 Tax=Sphingopyxis sp. MWB1 TaxID=1537715 RepID=UPI00051A1923|nr:ABC transporter permease [Sphingopyxis sp. MWB1]
MNAFVRTMFVVARRDFLAMVATPTFLLFLLAPLFVIGMGFVGKLGGEQLADSSKGSARIVAVVERKDVGALRAADRWLRAGFNRPPPTLEIRVAQTGGSDAPVPALPDANAIAQEKGKDTLAVMTGPLSAPTIAEEKADSGAGRYLALLAREAQRQRAATALPQSRPQFALLSNGESSIAAQQAIGFGAVFVLFLLTLLLASQAVGSLAEEKGNKVIEILAAAVPLEGVFLGKLLGMFGVAILFIGFWALIAIGGGLIAATQMDASALAAASGATDPTALLAAPATGWPFFLAVNFGYFTLAFLLLGAVFLGVGAQAATVREIQMLSLPITIFQVGMFSLSSAAAGAPDSRIARIAEIFPFSSPFAMAARAANDSGRMEHFIAIGWQAFWVLLVVTVSVRLFRSGVLSGQPSWKFWEWHRTG